MGHDLGRLADRALTTAEVHAELAVRGYERTENTVRHHVNEFRAVGLVEVARLEEGRGGTEKYYRANTIVLPYSLPVAGGETVDRLADELAPAVADLLDDLLSDHGDEVAAVADEMAPREHRRDQKYETYLLLTILRRAFVRGRAR